MSLCHTSLLCVLIQTFSCLPPFHCTLSFLELPLIKLVDGHLDGQDVVAETAVAGTAVPGGDSGAFCSDQTPLLQLGYVFAHCVDAHSHRLPNRSVAGQTLVGLPVLLAHQVAVDYHRTGG